MYDDLITTKQERKGPKLQIVPAQLVSTAEMPAARRDDDDDTDDAEWFKRAQAAARFYGNQVTDYDDGRVMDEKEHAGALEQIMQGCTAVVSCVGSVRTTKPWQDWWLTRLLRKDVRSWCADAQHPFYTQYYTTRKLVHLAEREQERRNVLFQRAQSDHDNQEKDCESAELMRRRRGKNAPPRRIRFVRLSDLAVTQQPWHVVPLLTNALRSMVFRYHEMADDLVVRSRLLDTVIVRAGDLVDEERDEDEVGVQVQVDDYLIRNATGTADRSSCTMTVHVQGTRQNPTEQSSSTHTPCREWSPARVGREDVASLLSAAVLAPWLTAENQTNGATSRGDTSIHATLAVRWSGDARAMAPYPAQGKKTNGCRTSEKSLKKAIQKWQKGRQVTVEASAISRFKPYGLCVAIPLYFAMGLLLRNLTETFLLASQGSRILRNLAKVVFPTSRGTSIIGAGVLPFAFLPTLPSTSPVHKRVAPLRLSRPTEGYSERNSSSVEWNPASATPQQQGSLYDESEMDDKSGDVHIPSGGISVYDEMDSAQRDRFVSDLRPLPGLQGVAQITSSPQARYSFEPLRYLVAMSPPQLQKREHDESSFEHDGSSANDRNTNDSNESPPTKDNDYRFGNATFAMIDVPPFSPQLAARMKSYMGINHTLAAILVTSRDAIHYDEAQATFTTRRSDLHKWKQAFPGVEIVAYRLDTPRDCQGLVSQRLDGYGPFAADETTGNLTFVETGRPLTYDEWDYSTAQNVLSGTTPPPDDEQENEEDDEKYSPEAIRAREEGKTILAIYTPGHSFGSVSYVFPQMNVCCSGFTLPVEDSRIAENEGFVDTGPALDARGYLTTSRAGIRRQMESARALVNNYHDRFNAILPSRGAPLLLGGSDQVRKDELLAIIQQYERIGQIYESLGITSSGEEGNEHS